MPCAYITDVYVKKVTMVMVITDVKVRYYIKGHWVLILLYDSKNIYYFREIILKFIIRRFYSLTLHNDQV
jgi:hypothetical protein